MGWIYLIRNIEDGKCYVGQTRRTVEVRWNQHKLSVNLKKEIGVLQRALRLHGIEKFSFEIICEVPNEDLDAREIQEIAERNTIVPNGYNLQKGGKMKTPHPTTRAKISQTRKGRTGMKHTEETKKKMSESHKGEKSYLFGKVYTDEEKEQMMLNSRSAKKVNQYTLDEKFIKTWASVTQIRRELNNASVSLVCNGVLKTSGGFKWTWNTGSEEYVKPQVVQEQLENRKIRASEYRAKNAEYIKEWHQEWYKRLKNNLVSDNKE